MIKFGEYILKENNFSNEQYSIDNIDLPDGVYDGIRGGNTVNINNSEYKSNNGVRGRNIKCSVLVKNKKGKFIYKDLSW